MSVHIFNVSKGKSLTVLKNVMRKNKGEEVEIELEFESGVVCDFIPDFGMLQNTADYSALQWRLSGTGTPFNVEFLCDEFQDEESTDSTIFSCPDV